ncbi:MAG: hypothetical protein H6825_13200 [Planctomycetes bacterium]|nr:hypothetical protein [Planctomycetota bacterium]
MVERNRELGTPLPPRALGERPRVPFAGAASRSERASEDGTSTGEVGEHELAILRDQLLGPELRRIAAIERRLERRGLTPEDVARVLPAAIRLRQSHDGQLGRALGPTLEGAIQDSVRRNPTAISEALFPVLGPAIRRSIGAALSGLVESFNAALGASLGLRGLRWHLEARRTGRSFAEVALLHSIAWRTELVLLVHRETGTLLLSAQADALTPARTTPDGDVVSAMLAAIQDFVSDSFADGERTQLNRIAFDDRTLHVAVGPKVTLAALVRGAPPAEFVAQIQETCDLVHVLATARLAGFRGDTTPFVTLQPTLDDLLREEKVVHRSSRRGLLTWSLALVVASGLCIGWIAQRAAETARLASAVEALRAEPGVVVVSAARQAGRPALVLMRDPDAAAVTRVLLDAGVDPELLDIHEEPYVCLMPQFVQQRALAALSPPPTVDVELHGGRLVLRGTASHRWIQRVDPVASALPGVTSVDLAALVDIDEGRVTSSSFRLERSALTFAPGEARPAVEVTEQTDLRQMVQLLANGARSVGWVVRVELLGSATDEEVLADPSLALRRAYAAERLVETWSDGVLMLEASDARAQGRAAPAPEVRFRVTIHGTGQ